MHFSAGVPLLVLGWYLPGLLLMSGTWVCLVVSAVLCLGVVIFIRKEERDLLRVLGDEYQRYTARVHRIIPFVKP
jgi:protein-S-isoprenylcysteine O-methyltransferase Ste14